MIQIPLAQLVLIVWNDIICRIWNHPCWYNRNSSMQGPYLLSLCSACMISAIPLDYQTSSAGPSVAVSRFLQSHWIPSPLVHFIPSHRLYLTNTDWEATPNINNLTMIATSLQGGHLDSIRLTHFMPNAAVRTPIPQTLTPLRTPIPQSLALMRPLKCLSSAAGSFLKNLNRR